MHWFFSAFDHVAAEPWVHLFAGKATTSEKRVCSSTFALMPILVAVSLRYKPDSLAFLLLVGGFLLTGYLLIMLCVRFVPAIVSWVAGTIAWLALLALILARSR